jgi:N-acylneuraminate cytidylyltransferase
MPDGVARVVAVIPARGGSKGVPAKNLRLVGGLPLVARSVLAARRATRVDAVYVSTDDAAIAAVACRYGAEVIDRPADISGDTASSEAALLHALDVLKAAGGEPDVLVFLQCTSPFTRADEIDRCVAALDADGVAAALAVAPDHGFLWTLGPDGLGAGVNHDAHEPRQRRQDLPPQFRETGSVYAMRVPAFRTVGRRFCGPVGLVPIESPPVEIDSEADLALCEALARGEDKGEATSGPPAGLKALVMDFDGVHTDDRVYVGDDGREAVACSRGDGLGLGLLKAGGFKLLILSKERNPVVTARGEKLGIEVRQGCDDKLPAFDAWLAENGLSRDEAAYIGNDVNDLACLAAAGWSLAPADAHAAVLKAVDYVTKAEGGRGALREVAEMLLAADG